MKKIAYLILILVLISCQKEDTDAIPTYIKIDPITLEEDITSKITDVYVYINDQMQGVYELPAKFPVLAKGNTKVKIYAGIKNNGIAAERAAYPFYHPYTINTELTINSTIVINPEISIKENISGQFDDFDPSYSFNADSCFQTVSNGPYGNYGLLTLDTSTLITEINYKDYPLSFDDVPQQGSPTYLELDYKNNTQFLIGMYINSPNSPTLERGLVLINPKEEWNKIYIDLTQTVSEAINAESFSVFIRMQKDSHLDESTLAFDNIRIIHYEK